MFSSGFFNAVNDKPCSAARKEKKQTKINI